MTNWNKVFKEAKDSSEANAVWNFLETSRKVEVLKKFFGKRWRQIFKCAIDDRRREIEAMIRYTPTDQEDYPG